MTKPLHALLISISVTSSESNKGQERPAQKPPWQDNKAKSQKSPKQSQKKNSHLVRVADDALGEGAKALVRLVHVVDKVVAQLVLLAAVPERAAPARTPARLKLTHEIMV
jgi:hypothetical protein